MSNTKERERLLELQDVSFSYGDKQVLHKVALSICRGEKIAVMGPNGAGKSTFFLQLNGVLQPDEGKIFLENRAITKKNARELCKKVGFVFQDADSQLIASNVREEISFGPMNMGLCKEEVKRRVEAVIHSMSLGEMEGRAPHELSGGEKKRVSIADVLAMQPEILLFDEPMSALDPVNAEQVEQILKRLHKEGKTLLIATHDVDFAYRFADRILVFSEGSIIADGVAETIFQDTKIREQAHLKEPIMMTIWNSLVEGKFVSTQTRKPITTEQFTRLMREEGKGK